MEIGKIVQIAIASDQENGEAQLFLDDNGIVWEWKYESERIEWAEYQDARGNIEILKGQRSYKKLVPVDMSHERVIVYESFSGSYHKDNPTFKEYDEPRIIQK